ncbi:MAG TPA: RICIN domain-containing protein [Actinocrinis sp.]|nr:RICIN domain-containing protein [Actinocrinis sp.]
MHDLPDRLAGEGSAAALRRGAPGAGPVAAGARHGRAGRGPGARRGRAGGVRGPGRGQGGRGAGSSGANLSGNVNIASTGGVGATASGTLLQTWNHGGPGNTNALFAANAQSGGYHPFTADNSGLCLDVPNASTASGVQLEQYTCNGTGAQSFQLVQ